MRYILIASAVIVFISTLGVNVACLKASSTRGFLTALYLCFGLPSFVFLVFVSASSLALRDDADRLVSLYWNCLKAISPTPDASAVPEVFHHAEAATSICIAATVLLFVGLLTACRVIGWRVLAHHAIMVIALLSALVGFATLGVGIVLKVTSKSEHIFFDGAIMGLGGSALLISIIGIVGVKCESTCLLRTYALMLLMLLFAIFGVAVYLLVDGTDALTLWLDGNWAHMQEHVCNSLLSTTCTSTTAASATVQITFQEAKALATSHLVAITTLVTLLFLVLLVDLLMACTLQAILAHAGPDPREMELQPLAPDDDDDY